MAETITAEPAVAARAALVAPLTDQELAALVAGTAQDGGLTDDELAALALAADPDVELSDDAVPVWDVIGGGGVACRAGLLPAWYMPTATAAGSARRGWHRTVAIVLIASFLLIDALGLCITYGTLVAA